MKVNIVDKKENQLLKRTEYIIELDYEGKSTPSRKELQSFLATELKASQELIEVSKIFSEIGLTKGKAWVKVWKEKPPEIRKKWKQAEKKAEEKPAEAPKEEVKEEIPKEEVKEEPKKEELKPEPEKSKEEVKEEPKEEKA